MSYLPRKTASSCAVLIALASPAYAFQQTRVLLSGHFDNNPTDNGFETELDYLHVVTPEATFIGNAFNGLFVSTSSVVVNGGRFEGNSNVGLQAVLPPGKTVIINGGNFSRNYLKPNGRTGAGADVDAARLTVNGGNFTGNGAFGLSTSSKTIVRGGVFSENIGIGIASWSNRVRVYSGEFSNNGIDFAVLGSGTIQLFGSFDLSGVLLGDGSFTGRLRDSNTVQTFTYATFDSGKIILSPVRVSPVPESSPRQYLLATLLIYLCCAFAPVRRNIRC